MRSRIADRTLRRRPDGSAVDPANPGAGVERFDLPLGDSHDVLAVPVGAIVELDGVPSLWLKTRAEVFAARPVALGRREGGFVEVRGDIRQGALVVVAGSPFLRGAAPAPVEAR